MCALGWVLIIFSKIIFHCLEESAVASFGKWRHREIEAKLFHSFKLEIKTGLEVLHSL